MADVKVNSTGRVFWRIDDGVAQLLQEAFPESFSRVEKPAPAPIQTAPKYFVGLTHPTSGRYAIIRRWHNSDEFITGTREQIKKLYPDCPDDVITKFENVSPNDRAAQRG